MIGAVYFVPDGNGKFIKTTDKEVAYALREQLKNKEDKEMNKELKKVSFYADGVKMEFDDGSTVLDYSSEQKVKFILSDGSSKCFSYDEILKMAADGKEISDETKAHNKQYWLGVIENLELDGEYLVVDKKGDVVATVKGKILTVLDKEA